MDKPQQDRRMLADDPALAKKTYSAYKVEDGNILLLNGPYQGYWVKEMWFQGSDERDYIFKHIYKRGEPEVVKIIKELFCK